jgi:hypothetical protein
VSAVKPDNDEFTMSVDTLLKSNKHQDCRFSNI